MAWSDQDILTFLSTDKEKGIKVLFDTYYKPLCVYAIRFVNDLSQAEDMVQDVFIKIWEDKNPARMTSFRSYLFTAVHNKCLSHIRKTKPEFIDDYTGIEPVLEVIDEQGLEERRKQLNKAMEALPPKTREVFEAIVLKDMSYKETAAMLGVTVNTVKTQLARAYRLLRGSLDIIILHLLLDH